MDVRYCLPSYVYPEPQGISLYGKPLLPFSLLSLGLDPSVCMQHSPDPRSGVFGLMGSDFPGSRVLAIQKTGLRLSIKF